MWDLCEQFVCIQNDVKKINDVPWGGGYKACREEFDKALRNLAMWGYGVIILAHVDTKTEKDAKTGEDVEIIGPSIPSRAYAIVNQMVDIIGYVSVEYDAEGNSTRWLYTRATPRVMAGSRFAHLPPKIPFTYADVTEALSAAIEAAGVIDGATIVDKEVVIVAKKKDFDLLKKEAYEVWTTLNDRDKGNVEKMGHIIENIFGSRVKLSEVPLSQQDLFELALEEIKTML